MGLSKSGKPLYDRYLMSDNSKDKKRKRTPHKEQVEEGKRNRYRL